MFLSLLIALAATPDCEGACTARAGRCFSSCGGATRCAGRCELAQNDCFAACAKKEDAREAAALARKPRPCGVSAAARAPRPCSDDEQKLIQGALASREARALKRGEGGNLTVAPEQLARAQQLYEQLKGSDECLADGGVGAQCTTND